jgi:hypothetical protein
MYPYQSTSAELVPQDGRFYTDINGYGQAYAQPVIFEPQDLPVNFALDTLLQDYQGPDPDELIATWVQIEEENSGEAGQGDYSWQQDPNLVASSWGEMSGKSNLSSTPGILLIITGDNQQQYFDELDLSLPMAVDFAPYLTESNLYPAGAYHVDQPTVDYNTGYLSYSYQTPGAGPSRNADPGPFLSMAQPPSPDPNATTPRQSTFARNSSNTFDPNPEVDENHQSSTPSMERVPRMSMRYVSSSAFPDTPLSVDPSGLGGNDRRVSYANANPYGADDGTGSESETGAGARWSREADPSSADSQAVKTPILALSPSVVPRIVPAEMPLSPISPVNSQDHDSINSPSPQKPGAGPPRGQRRARTVAGSFH